MQDHNVPEVVWLNEVGSHTKVLSKWLQDMKGNAVKGQVFRHNRSRMENVTTSFQAPHQLQLLAHCWHWRPEET